MSKLDPSSSFAAQLQRQSQANTKFAFAGRARETSSCLLKIQRRIRPETRLPKPASRPFDFQAYGSQFSGCIGDILARYFQRKGGVGIVVDGRIRDSGRIRDLGLPVWSTGVTPHYASQSELFPWAYDVPVAVGSST